MRWTNSKATSLISLLALVIFLPLLLLAAYQTATLISRALGVPANIIVDTQAVLEPLHTGFYHAFTQGGEEANDMLSPVAGQIRQLQPKLIRLDHLYDHYVDVGRAGSDLTFDWSKLDAAVDTILSTGAKPVLALSYMPSAIAVDGNIINPPANWNDWALVVQRTIEHYSGARGLRDIYYEVWNEPDLDIFGKWGLSGSKNYLTLYHYASVGASAATGVNRFYLGGPATTGLYKNWIIALVNSGNRLNFFSWHTYLYDPKRFTQDEANLITWLLPYPQYTLLPKLITEFGFTGGKSKLYGGSFASAHMAAVVRQLISGGPTYIFSFELKDGPNQEAGDGWGLITHETNGARAKPRFYVYNFLDPMEGDRLAVFGEGTWVTGFASTKNGVARLMLVNFDQNGSHVENVPVSFTSLTPGTYKYREHLLFGRDVTTTETVAETTLSRQVYMPAESVAILELTKQ